MKTYDWVLFDADDTLFHFDAYHGLQRTLLRFGMALTEQDYAAYQQVNQALWVDYQQGTITTKQLRQQRFATWANQLQIPPLQLDQMFMAEMAEICAPLAGAVDLLNTLRGKAKLGIITNGFTELQQVRLQRTGLQNHFQLLVVSEEVGIAKPHPGIFEHALANMGHPPREKVLMVGDNLDSDILGGSNAGLDTCWLNRHNQPLSKKVMPRYQVTSLMELEQLVLKGFVV